jgi:hypothetical protein
MKEAEKIKLEDIIRVLGEHKEELARDTMTDEEGHFDNRKKGGS